VHKLYYGWRGKAQAFADRHCLNRLVGALGEEKKGKGEGEDLDQHFFAFVLDAKGAWPIGLPNAKTLTRRSRPVMSEKKEEEKKESASATAPCRG